MNISIRMLKIVSIILWIIIIFFSITAVLSVMNLGINIGEIQIFPLGDGITFSLPFSISNNGYYEIADLNITSRVTDYDGKVLDTSETLIHSIQQGTNISDSHQVSVDLDSILTLDKEFLLLEDSEFHVEIFAGLNFARAVPVQLSTNTTIPWGAPFANLSIGHFSVSPYNLTHVRARLPLSFENHALLDISGTLLIEVYNNTSEPLTTGMTRIDVPSGSIYSDDFYVIVHQTDVTELIDGGLLHMVFETPMFTLEWDEQYD